MIEYLKRAAPTEPERTQEIVDTVSTILSEIEHEGLPAIRRWSERLDGWSPRRFTVDAATIAAASTSVNDELRGQLDFALEQVRGFARAQLATITELEVETLPGVTLGHKLIPIRRVGSYSPGGRYPLIASSIMTIAVPKVAGVDTVVGCAPPRDAGGIYAPQLYTMQLAGADAVVCLGGAQGLAALAFGIEDVPPADLVVGAGNSYVAEAKRQIFGHVGIDLLAGPTEILVIADSTADPRVVAADLLGQAEHGPTSPAVVVAIGRDVAEATLHEVERWLVDWPTAEVAGEAWRNLGEVIACDTRDEAVTIADEYATEHLEIQTEDPDWILGRVRNFGSAFVGSQATVTYGDKAIGVNHVLPTKRAARYTGGLWVGKFIKTVTYQRVTAAGSQIVAPQAAGIADAELMAGHALSARLRLAPST